MGKLVFYYGTMGSSKSASALMKRFQYVEHGKTVFLMKSSVDNRDDYIDVSGNAITKISSRVGISAVAYVVSPEQSIFDVFNPLCDVVICDEAQFLTEDQVDELRQITYSLDIDVFCYGLRTDFTTKLFTGSRRLFEVADDIVELKSICGCGKDAIVNARIDENGNVVVSGDKVLIGGNDRYKPMCMDCWNKNKKINI